VKILASGAATSTLSLTHRKDMADLDVVELSAERAYKMAGLTPGDIHVAEVHDCFAIAEICCYEALGFVERGKGKDAAKDGVTDLGGRIPVNISGGLKSKGHPVGATGIAQAITIVEQLRGEAGESQVEGARVGLAQNMGGSGASSAIHIFQGV
jgi:acetyl-CoA C-acetyltransferase